MSDLTNGVAAPPRRRCRPHHDADRAGHGHFGGDDLGRYARPASSAFPTIQFATKGAGTCGPTVRVSSRG